MLIISPPSPPFSSPFLPMTGKLFYPQCDNETLKPKVEKKNVMSLAISLTSSCSQHRKAGEVAAGSHLNLATNTLFNSLVELK